MLSKSQLIKIPDSKDGFVLYNEPVEIPDFTQKCKRLDPAHLFGVSGSRDKADRSKQPYGETGVTKEQYVNETLNHIFPPKEWKQNGQVFRQTISTKQATKEDVKALTAKLNKIIEQEQILDNGICPVRRKLFDQLFDEIIRQEAIDCGERGLMMMKLRDENQRLLTAYQVLTNSSINFGVRKAIESEAEIIELNEGIEKLEKEISELEDRRLNLEEEVAQTMHRANELKKADLAKRAEENDALEKRYQQIMAYMDKLVEIVDIDTD